MVIMEEEKENNQSLIEELRKKLLSRGPELQDFNERDIDRVQASDDYVWKFLVHKDKDVERAFQMMVECLKWRESFGINEIMERNIDRHLFEIGFLYPRNVDKNDNVLLLFHTKLYKKELYNIAEVKKLFAFGLEKMVENNLNKRITMIFDMQESGLANMDMDFLKFVVTCFQTYFPNLLEYLIVYETPWILTTAAWKIVKTWLGTEGISKFKFVKKTEILQFVDQDQLLTCMGGTDEFVYKYPPQLFSAAKDAMRYSPPIRNRYVDSLLLPSKNEMFSSMSLNVDDKVAFTQEQQQHQQQQQQQKVPLNDQEETEQSLTDGKPKPIIKTEINDPLVSVQPSNELTFTSFSPSNEPTQQMRITNNVVTMVAFKIKTTSPENYRVKPSSGRIPPGETVEINVQLQPGYLSSVSKDKFLIMTTVMPKGEITDYSTMWKTIPKISIHEQRLRCRYDGSATHSAESDRESTHNPRKTFETDPLYIISKHLMEFDNKIENVQKKISLLEQDIKLIFRVLIFFVCIFTFSVLLFAIYLFRDVLKNYFS